LYDIFFLSHGESIADLNWQEFTSKYENLPHARRVDGIDGILNAHKYCAALSRTSNFFVIDADNEVLDVDFSIKLSIYDKNYVHIWKAKNPMNDLVYGWGGIKLFPKKLLLKLDYMPLDMTTSFPLKIMSELGSITHFNTSAFDTWRSAFRECVKLSRNDDKESNKRLNVWCSVAHGPYSDWCLAGACAGREHGVKYKNDPDMLMKINDWAWLEKKFEDVKKSS
jgi:hypothetical protein